MYLFNLNAEIVTTGHVAPVTPSIEPDRLANYQCFMVKHDNTMRYFAVLEELVPNAKYDKIATAKPGWKRPDDIAIKSWIEAEWARDEHAVPKIDSLYPVDGSYEAKLRAPILTGGVQGKLPIRHFTGFVYTIQRTYKADVVYLSAQEFLERSSVSLKPIMDAMADCAEAGSYNDTQVNKAVSMLSKQKGVSAANLSKRFVKDDDFVDVSVTFKADEFFRYEVIFYSIP